MKKRILTCLGLLGLVVLGTAFLAMPEQADAKAACGTTCDCDGPLLSTVMVWGNGATCTEAFNDALAQSRALQSCADGVCYEQVIIDAPCAEHNGGYMIDLHTDYRCYSCSLNACESPLPNAEVN